MMEVTCHNMPQVSKYLRGRVQTEGKYSELINLFKGKPEILPAAGMYWYVKLRILQIYIESPFLKVLITELLKKKRN